MLNPVALLRSASSRSSSSRFAINSSSSKDEAYESSSDFSEESCVCSGSHQSTLDKLYAWEKKLYQEVRVNHLNQVTRFISLDQIVGIYAFSHLHILGFTVCLQVAELNSLPQLAGCQKSISVCRFIEPS